MTHFRQLTIYGYNNRLEQLQQTAQVPQRNNYLLFGPLMEKKLQTLALQYRFCVCVIGDNNDNHEATLLNKII